MVGVFDAFLKTPCKAPQAMCVHIYFTSCCGICQNLAGVLYTACHPSPIAITWRMHLIVTNAIKLQMAPRPHVLPNRLGGLGNLVTAGDLSFFPPLLPKVGLEAFSDGPEPSTDTREW